jgi:hypothetical protein
MYRTNKKIKEYLKENGFTNLYLFPHLRSTKDYTLSSCGFDAFGWKGKQFYLFQFKTNMSCSKKQRELYKELKKNYNAIPMWITFWNKNKRNKKHPNEIEVWE